MKTKLLKTMLLGLFSAGLLASCNAPVTPTEESTGDTQDTSLPTEDSSDESTTAEDSGTTGEESTTAEESDTSEEEPSDTSEDSGDTGDTGEDSGDTGDTGEDSGDSGDTGDTGDTGSSEDIPTTWSDEILAAMTEALDGVVLPFINASWVMEDVGLDFGLTANDVAVADVNALYVADELWSESEGLSGADYCYERLSPNGTVYVGLMDFNGEAVVGALFQKGASDTWDDEDIELMEEYLFGVTLPHPAGAWIAPYVTSDYTVITYTAEPADILDDTAELFADNGYDVAVDPEDDGYIFTIVAPEDYQGEPVYVNGYIFYRETRGTILNAFASLAPMVDFSIEAELEHAEVKAGAEVELFVELGASYPDDANVVIEVSPEGAATLNEELVLTEGRYVFTIDEELEIGAEIEFLVTVDGYEAEAVVNAIVVDPDYRYDWTEQEKYLMEHYLNFEIPFLGNKWHVVEEEDGWGDLTAVIYGEEAGLADVAFETFLKAGYTYRGFEGYGLFIVQKVLPEEGEQFTPFVYYLGLGDNEEGTKTELYIAGYDDYAFEWSKEDADLMTQYLGEALPILPGVYDPFVYAPQTDSDGDVTDVVYTVLYTGTAEEYLDVLLLEENGYEYFSFMGYEFISKALDEYRTIYVDLYMLEDGAVIISAYLVDSTPAMSDQFPVEELTAFLRDELGEEFNPVLVTEFTLPEEVTVTFGYSNGDVILNFSRELTVEELQQLASDYIDDLLEAGYTEYGSGYFDSPDAAEFYVYLDLPQYIDEPAETFSLSYWFN